MTGPAIAVALALAGPPEPDFKPVLDQWRELGVRVKLKSKDCGYDNAWYIPARDTVVMCRDLFDRPDLARHILHHELAHALFDQRGVNALDEEMQADELAFWMESEAETLAAVKWHMSKMDGDEVTLPGEHPSDADRATMFLCLLDGLEQFPVSNTCQVYARSSRAAWVAILLPLAR